MDVARGVDLGVVEELLRTVRWNLLLFIAALVIVNVAFALLAVLPYRIGWFIEFSREVALFTIPVYFLIRVVERVRGVPIWTQIHSSNEIAVRRNGELYYLSKGSFYSFMYIHIILLAGALWGLSLNAIVNQDGSIGYLEYVLEEGGYLEAVEVFSLFAVSIEPGELSAHAVHLFITIVLAFCLITPTIALTEKTLTSVLSGPNRSRRLQAFCYLEFLVIRQMVLDRDFYWTVALGYLAYLVLRELIIYKAISICIESGHFWRCLGI